MTDYPQALAISFDLVSVAATTEPVAPAVNAGVDNVSVELMAPIAVKFTPKTFNVKSNGVVTVELSKPPVCLTLDEIDQTNLKLLVVGGSDYISPISVHRAAMKLLL